MSEELVLRESNGYIHTIRFNRPERRNTFTKDLLTQVGDIFKELSQDESCRVVVLRGAERKAFSAGVDFLAASNDGPNDTLKALNYCLQTLMDFPAPIIAMIHGYTMGSGLDVATICDFRMASDTARFSANLVRRGRTYYLTAIHRLINVVGMANAKEILLGGRTVDAKRAKEMGLVTSVHPADELSTAVYALAREIAEESGPLAIRATKEAINRIIKHTSSLTPEVEAEINAMLDKANNSQDAMEGPIAFIQKRKPEFKGI